MKNKNNWLELAGQGANEVPVVPEPEVDFDALSWNKEGVLLFNLFPLDFV